MNYEPRNDKDTRTLKTECCFEGHTLRLATQRCWRLPIIRKDRGHLGAMMGSRHLAQAGVRTPYRTWKWVGSSTSSPGQASKAFICNPTLLSESLHSAARFVHSNYPGAATDLTATAHRVTVSVGAAAADGRGGARLLP